MEALWGFKWGEVVNYTTLSYPTGYSTGMFIVMNKGKWNSLPPDIQKVFDEVNAEWIEKQGNVWDEIEKEGKDFILKKGNKIISLSKEEEAKWTAAVKPLLDEYVKNMKAKGLPGDEALKFCLDYLKANQK
jgi:TRAP-type C4-dicarboxylate transport system substrate-binding protein